MKYLFQTKTLLLLIVSVLFYSCKPEPPCEGCQANKPPIAVAGPDSRITLPTDSVLLDGSASNDPDGKIATWEWKKINGPASLNIANSLTAKATAKKLEAGIYLFELTVADDGGLKAKDTVQVAVNDPLQPNRPPIADAGPDQTIQLPATLITLNGSASTDPDNNIINYLWTKISGPTSFNLMNANSVQTQVTSLIEGTYLFELKVTDDGGLVTKDTVQISIMPLPILNLSKVNIAGWGRNASGKTVARISREGVLQDLSDGQFDAYALSVFVSGTDIYVAGNEKNASGKSLAKLWKNGVAQNLSLGQYDAEATSVFVYGTNVYVAGWEVNASGNRVARLWKNGVAQNFSDGQQSAQANSVFVSGSDVYVAGHDWYGAQLWKNGVSQTFSNGQSDAVVYSVFVSGNDVYMAGGGYWGIPGVDPTLWKNGQLQSLEWQGDHIGSSVFVSGSDVYVAGASGPARLWKNGLAQSIGEPNDVANSVFVSGNDVYVAGNKVDYNGTASLWKNGVGYSIQGLNVANSVYVQ